MFLKQVGPSKHLIFAKILILDRKKNIRDVYDLGLLKIIELSFRTLQRCNSFIEFTMKAQKQNPNVLWHWIFLA